MLSIPVGSRSSDSSISPFSSASIHSRGISGPAESTSAEASSGYALGQQERRDRAARVTDHGERDARVLHGDLGGEPTGVLDEDVPGLDHRPLAVAAPVPDLVERVHGVPVAVRRAASGA